MNMNLEHNDYVSNIFVLVKKDDKYAYYFSDKTLWFIDNWFYEYGDEDYVKLGLEANEKYKVEMNQIANSFNELKDKGLTDVIECNKPALFIDFEEKLFKSRYYEQALHFNIPDDWKGLLVDFLELVPQNYKYWETNELV